MSTTSKRTTRKPPVQLHTRAPSPIVVHPLTAPPFVAGAYATKLATVIAESSIRVPEALYTSVTAVVTTNTYRVNPTCVGIELEISRLEGQRQAVRLDIPATQIDVLLQALTDAVALADRSGVLTSARIACGNAIAREKAMAPQ